MLIVGKEGGGMRALYFLPNFLQTSNCFLKNEVHSFENTNTWHHTDPGQSEGSRVPTAPEGQEAVLSALRAESQRGREAPREGGAAARGLRAVALSIFQCLNNWHSPSTRIPTLTNTNVIVVVL